MSTAKYRIRKILEPLRGYTLEHLVGGVWENLNINHDVGYPPCIYFKYLNAYTALMEYIEFLQEPEYVEITENGQFCD